MTQAAEIRRAIKRTQGFRDWFKRTVPKKAVDLDVTLDDPTEPYRNEVQMAQSKPAGKLISCGTVGCVLGWAITYPPLRRRLSKGATPHAYIGVEITGDDSVFDSCGPTEEANQKAAAIARLNKHIKGLREVLKDVV
jgi:hypothetical protein